MGRDKALVAVDGRVMIEHVTATLTEGGCDPVWIAGGGSELTARLGHLGYEVLADPVAGAGPLAGVMSALTAADARGRRWVAVVAVDLPRITPSVVRRLSSHTRDGLDVVVARTDRIEPAVAVWSTTARHAVSAALSTADRALRDVIASLRSVEVSVDANSIRNVNSPDDLAAVEEAPSTPRRAGLGTLSEVAPNMAMREIGAAELAALGDTVRVVDVREPDEWQGGHIAHARHVPLATVPGRIDAFDGAPTYVICRSGGRSAQACSYLAEQGIEAVNVAGGMIAWTAAGFDVVTGD